MEVYMTKDLIITKNFNELLSQFVNLYPNSEIGSSLSKTYIHSIEKEYYPFLFTEEIIELYSFFNGLDNFEDYFEPLENTLKVREEYTLILKETRGIHFPSSLFPLYRDDPGHCFVPLSQKHAKASPIFEFAIAHGDNEIYLLYNSIKRFIATILESHQHKNENIWNAAWYRQLNPDAHFPTQKGKVSPNGIINVYNIEHLPQNWDLSYYE